MAKRKRSVTETVSLFPFLSILACVIGTLTLMITALALGQIERRQDPEAVARALEHQKMQAEIRARQKEFDRFNRLLADAAALREELVLAMEELKKLEGRQKQETKKASSNRVLNARLLAEANLLERRIKELEQEPPRLRAKIRQLQAEINKRKNPPKEAANRIQPGGSGVDLDPTFVECTDNGVRILEGGKPFIRRADLSKSKPFHDLLDRVAKKPKGTVIFLIRDDAVGTYNTAHSIARGRYCRDGKLPVVGKGNIDLSVFQHP